MKIKINSLNLLTMEQQTAVDWFFENIKSYFTKDGDVFEDIVFTMSIAKLKEKQQIIDAWKDNRDMIYYDEDKDELSESTIIELAEQYYKRFEKFKKD